MKKRQVKKGQGLLQGLFFPIVFGAAVGLSLGWYSTSYQNFGVKESILFIFSLTVFFILHIFIHELGHLFFGLISGYQFGSIRFFSWLFQKNVQGKLQIYKFRMKGTLGQCLMVPPENKPFHFKLYLAGGGLMNLLSSAIILLLVGPTSLYAISFTITGGILGITNLFPQGFNDGMTSKIANSSPEQKRLLYLQLKIGYLLSIGKTFKELPHEFYEPIPPIPTQTYFNDWQDFLIGSQFLEKGEWRLYRKHLEEKWLRKEELILPYQIELKKELLFVLCLTDPTDERIVELWQDKQVKQSMKANLISNQRIRIVYTKYILKDDYAANALLKETKQKDWQIANKGESLTEKHLLDILAERFISEKEVEIS